MVRWRVAFCTMPEVQALPPPAGSVGVRYTQMKRRALEKKLREYGWSLLRHGGGHDIWTNGWLIETIPRHVEIEDHLARAIVRRAREAAT